MTKRVNCKAKKTKRNRRIFNFIDDEAGVSGNETDDENITATQGALSDIEIEEVEDDDPAVDMQAKYLQSVRYIGNKYGQMYRQIRNFMLFLPGVRLLSDDFEYQKSDIEIQWQHRIFFHSSLHQTNQNTKRFVHQHFFSLK